MYVRKLHKYEKVQVCVPYMKTFIPIQTYTR